MNWFELFYTFLGGLGIFFFGMKTLSESLQSMAGSFIRRVIRALTSNRIMAVGVGTFVTTLVQSSSVTTVMVVGLVTAGLMNLTQAIGVIMGANIGTTITGWIIAIKIGKYGLLFVGLGIFPMLFSRSDTFKNVGRLLLALGFVFLGLKFMGSAFKPLRGHEGFLEMMQYFSAESFVTLAACVAIGAILTMIIQSSSAMLGITIALAGTGSITYLTAAALVLGENIGTTITALLASIGASTDGKRAAKAHAVFNVLGVIWLLPFFWLYIDLVDWLIPGAPDEVMKDGSKPNIATHIAAGHSIFNVVNTLFFIPLLPYLAKFVTWITPEPAKKESKHLKYLPGVADFTAPSIAIGAAQNELVHMTGIVKKQIEMTRIYVTSAAPKKNLRDRIRHYEKITDNVQAEITVFLCKAQESRMSFEESTLSYAIIRAADEIESMSDYLEAVVRYRDSIEERDSKLTKSAVSDLKLFFELLASNFHEMDKTMAKASPWDMKKMHTLSDSLKSLGDQLYEGHRKRLEKKQCTPIAGIAYSDMLMALRKVNSHILNVAEALSGSFAEAKFKET